jgi:transposase
MQTTIQTLYKKGYSKARISRELGVSPKTIRKVLRATENGDGEIQKQPHPSVLDKHQEFIEIQRGKGLSRQRIYQDLVADKGYSGSYSAVRDFITKLEKRRPKAYMVLTALPGEEAQVDFGYIGTLKVKGKARKAWVFIMSLSYSRQMHVSITLDQTVQTFIQCHTAAFNFFGGVPETVKIDNLKAGVVETNFYEPIVQRTYSAYAAHYGFWPQPCRVYTPTDKGLVEANVKYVKDNCFKGRDFQDIQEAQTFLDSWLVNTANVRIHGTIKKRPQDLFNDKERAALKPLPASEFTFSKSATANVHTNCHLAYAANYYSAPYAYIGCEVDVIEINNLLKIYYQGKEIALHSLAKGVKGTHVTNTEHYPANKNITPTEILSRQELEIAEIGKHALEFFYAVLRKGELHTYAYRTISGILALRKTFPKDVIDQACKRAVWYESITYGTVKRICERGLIALPTDTSVDKEPDWDDPHPVRDLSEYDQLSLTGVISHE